MPRVDPPPSHVPLIETPQRNAVWTKWLYDLWHTEESSASCQSICVPAGSDVATIQAKIDEAESVPGSTVLFAPGAYDLGSTGIIILGDGIILQGLSPRFVGASLFGCELLYSGTGAAVTFGSSAKTAHYRNAINDIQIRATGGALTSATAIGLKTVNQHYFSSKRLALKDFEDGVGWLMTALGTGAFSALTTVYEILTHRCFTGIKTLGVNASIKENAATFLGGATIGLGASGEIGVDLDQYSDGFTFYGTDFESSDIGVSIAGTSHRFIGTRSEFNTTWGMQVQSTAVRTHVIGHSWAGSADETDTLDDSNGGVATYRIDERGIFNPPKIWPTVDKSEAFYMTKADGTTVVFDITTSGTFPSLTMPNSMNVIGYSDAFVTETYKMTGANGNVKGEYFTAAGTPVGVSAGQISFGGDTGTAVGAPGSADALPAKPLGYVDGYVAGTAVKIPYYSAAGTNTPYLVPTSMFDNEASAAVTPVSDVTTPFDGNATTLDEVTGAPGMDLSVNFTGVTSISGLVLRAYYDGSAVANHYVSVSFHNYDTTAEDIVIRLDDASDYNYRTILIPDDTDYISSGSAQVNFVHPTTGNPSHDLIIDYIAIIE